MITRKSLNMPSNVILFYRLLSTSDNSAILIFGLKKKVQSPFFIFFQIFTRYGKCYTFNSGQDGRPLLITMKGGMGNGLELMLDIQQDEYLPVWGETGTSH